MFCDCVVPSKKCLRLSRCVVAHEHIMGWAPSRSGHVVLSNVFIQWFYRRHVTTGMICGT